MIGPGGASSTTPSAQCLLAVERANRRELLGILKEEGSAEALAQYWRLKQKAD